VAAISVAPPNQRRASFSADAVKKDKNELHYLTYAFKSEDSAELQVRRGCCAGCRGLGRGEGGAPPVANTTN
jgi:hypothetical protein